VPHSTAAKIDDDTRHAGLVLRVVRVVGLLLFAAWVLAYIRSPESLLHGSILIFHEAGHVIFLPFGEFMMVLGGSLFQLMVPLFLVGYFLRRRDFYAACFAALYLAASMHNLSVYIADARAGQLPLLGGERSNHDWTFLLIELELLERDVAIGSFVHNLAMLVLWPSLLVGLWLGWQPSGRPEHLRPALVQQPLAARDDAAVQRDRDVGQV
jgi:hypothetical protein